MIFLEDTLGDKNSNTNDLKDFSVQVEIISTRPIGNTHLLLLIIQMKITWDVKDALNLCNERRREAGFCKKHCGQPSEFRSFRFSQIIIKISTSNIKSDGFCLKL